MTCSTADLMCLGQFFGLDISDEHDNDNILYLRENHCAVFEDKNDNVFMKKPLGRN